MPRIRGTGLGTGMALGTAAVVREMHGLPVAPAVPDRIAALIAARRTTEQPDIVLVARDYATALALAYSIGWGRVVAIAAETAPEDAPVPPFPAVVNLPGLMSSVQDDQLFLVDASSNFAFPDPDPMFLAQYTAEHERIAPKRRIYLDEGHYPAQTIDGQAVQVLALVDAIDDVEAAIQQGADGLFVSADSWIHRAVKEQQRKELFRLIHAGAGKPVIIADRYSLPAMLLCEAAVEADLTIAAPRLENGPDLDALLKELERMENACFDSQTPASMPRVAVLIPSLSHEVWQPEEISRWVEASAAAGASRAVFSMEQDTLGVGVVAAMDGYISACAHNLLPVYVSARSFDFNPFGQGDLENTLETAVRLLIGAGAAGIMAYPGDAARIKSCVANLDSEACRDLYWSVIQEARTE